MKCETENLDYLSLGIGYKDPGNLHKFLFSEQSGAWLGLRMACVSEWGAYPLQVTQPFFCAGLLQQIYKLSSFCSSCSKIVLCLLSSMVPQLFYSLSNDKQAVVISAAQSQISKFVLSVHLNTCSWSYIINKYNINLAKPTTQYIRDFSRDDCTIDMLDEKSTTFQRLINILA